MANKDKKKKFDLSGSGIDDAPSLDKSPLFDDSGANDNAAKPSSDNEENDKDIGKKPEVQPVKSTSAKSNRGQKSTSQKKPASANNKKENKDVKEKGKNRSVVLPDELIEPLKIILACGAHKNFNAYVVSLIKEDYEKNKKKYEALLMVQNMDPDELLEMVMGMNE